MKSQIKNLEINILMWFIMCAGVIGIAFNGYIHIAKNDAWIAPIIGMIVGIIPFSIFIKLMSYKDENNINDTLKEKWGIIGKIVSILLSFGVAFLVMVNFYNLNNFISSEYLYSTPKFYIAIMFVIPIIYTLMHEFHVISRSIMIFGYVAFFLFLAGLIGLSFQTNPNNIMPILFNGLLPPLKAGIYDVCYTVLPLFLLTIIPKDYIRNNENFNKRAFITYFLSSTCICIITYVVLATFGMELSLLYQYPTYNILKRITLLSIFDRIESIIAIMWILFIYVTCCMGCYYIKKTFFQVFNLEENKITKSIIFAIILIILFLSIFIFPNNTFVNKMLITFYPLILSVFFFIIPLIIFITIKIKK